MHSRDDNGKSPVLSQYEAANKAMSEATENDEPTDGVSGTTIEPITFNINSLQFTNERSKKVYVSGNFV